MSVIDSSSATVHRLGSLYRRFSEVCRMIIILISFGLGFAFPSVVWVKAMKYLFLGFVLLSVYVLEVLYIDSDVIVNILFVSSPIILLGLSIAASLAAIGSILRLNLRSRSNPPSE